MRSALALVGACAVLAATAPAGAQEYLVSGAVQAASGVESAGRGVQRARTRLRLGAELRVDEMPNDGLAFGALVELEPRSAVGGDLRYVRLLGDHLAVNAGGIAYVAPRTLLGAAAGIEIRVRLSRAVWFCAGPEATLFAAGSDLPDGTVLWQGLFSGGFRVDL